MADSLIALSNLSELAGHLKDMFLVLRITFDITGASFGVIIFKILQHHPVKKDAFNL